MPRWRCSQAATKSAPGISPAFARTHIRGTSVTTPNHLGFRVNSSRTKNVRSLSSKGLRRGASVFGPAHSRRTLLVCYLAVVVQVVMGGEASVGAQVIEARTIGVLDGDPREVFGRIGAIAVDDSGSVALLDAQALRVSLFSHNGRHRGAVGRAGGAPGEFRSPVSIDLGSHGEIFVLDEAYRRITEFRLRREGFELVGSLSVPIRATSFCRSGGDYYLLGLHRGLMVHRVDRNGEVLVSFGEPPEEVPEELRRHASILAELRARGRVTCADDASVFVALESSPEVTAYNASGERLWTTTIPEFKRLRYEVTGSGGRRLRMAPDAETGTVSTVGALVLVPDGLLAVSVGETSLEDPVAKVVLYLLDQRDGTIVHSQRWPGFVVGVARDATYWYMNDPFPRVVIDPRPVRGR
jgi:6-bladed beta-propeller protein